MRFIKHFLAATSLGLFAITASASPETPVENVEYQVLKEAQQTDSGKKVEIIEFFWYSCPTCTALSPYMDAWVKKQGDKVNVKHVPVAFRDSFIPEQKLYYTLEAMGKLDELNVKAFGKHLGSDQKVLAWAVNNGLDKEQFAKVYNSFGVQVKMQQAAQLQKAYNANRVPLIAVDGRFITSPAMVGKGFARNVTEKELYEATLRVVDWLVARSVKK